MSWFKRDKSKADNNDAAFVNVYDTTTHTVTRMPARELASHMVAANVTGIEGTVWIDSRELKPGDYKHPPFTEEFRDFLREIKAAIDEFYYLSLEDWEDGFRRDAHPEKEIALWLHLAEVYRRLTIERDLNTQQRHDYFKLLLTCLNSPREHILKVFSPTAISTAEAQNVIVEFYGDNKTPDRS